MTQRKFWYGLWCHSTSFTTYGYRPTVRPMVRGSPSFPFPCPPLLSHPLPFFPFSSPPFPSLLFPSSVASAGLTIVQVVVVPWESPRRQGPADQPHFLPRCLDIWTLIPCTHTTFSPIQVSWSEKWPSCLLPIYCSSLRKASKQARFFNKDCVMERACV